MQHVFIVGAKGIPAAYGGYETFVDKLTEYHQNDPDIKYHVACAVDELTEETEFTYHNAACFNIKWKNIGSAKAIIYDVDALKYCIKYIEKNCVSKPVIYILACRIGPFISRYVKKVHKLGGRVFVNPDGHEWMRAKWSAPVRKYWKFSERLMVKEADLLVCDSKNIEKYIHEEYARYNPKTVYISYGAETKKSVLADDDEKLLSWYSEKGLAKKEYYLVVGRFVPENNYEIMIREFMQSRTNKSFALIANVNDKLLQELKDRTGFNRDSRIKFVGTVYDQELLKKIRENAYGYFHGHEVGGTNPSLLEALGSTNLNLLLDVGFNRECAEDGALYWTKESGALTKQISYADLMSSEAIAEYGLKAKQRISSLYEWGYIASLYADVFIGWGKY